jgi:multidrug resistance efflux pump
VANQPALALVDRDSHWIEAYFRETWVGRIQPGDEAVVTLMSYPGKPFKGTVESIGWGIAQENGSTGESLLPNVNPSFEWIRLAQRIPVRIRVKDLPEGVVLRLGSTASVLVRTGTSGHSQGRGS